MRVDLALGLDFVSPLALLAILSWSHGLIRQRLPEGAAAPVLMGLAFGVIALLQMHAALKPVEGLIVDLRAVPVALAGAYLGWRGLLACLAVALVTRWQIGGIGMGPDLAGIALAGLAGLIWGRATRASVPRSLPQLAGLGLVTSGGALTWALLPPPLAGWMLGSALPVVALLTLAVVPALALILERERHAAQAERHMRRAGLRAARAAWPVEARFLDRLAGLRAGQGGSALTGPPVTAVLILWLRHGHWLPTQRGPAVIGHVLTGLRRDLPDLVSLGDGAGLSADGRILIALTEGEAARAGAILEAIRARVAAHAVALPDGDSARVRVVAKVVALEGAMTPAALAARLGTVDRRRRQTRPGLPRPDPLHPDLFERQVARGPGRPRRRVPGPVRAATDPP